MLGFIRYCKYLADEVWQPDSFKWFPNACTVLVSSRHYRASPYVMLEIKSDAARPLTLHIDVDLLDIEALLCPGVFRWSQLYWTISHSAPRLLIETHLADRHLVDTGSIENIFVDQMTDRRCVDQARCRPINGSSVRRPKCLSVKCLSTEIRRTFDIHSVLGIFSLRLSFKMNRTIFQNHHFDQGLMV